MNATSAPFSSQFGGFGGGNCGCAPQPRPREGTRAVGAYLMTPQLEPQGNAEFTLGKLLADSAVEASVGHIVFSTPQISIGSAL